MSDTLKRTPLYQQHLDAGARLVPFAGFEMPIQYSGIIDEHHAVRQAAGMFDVSHMGEVYAEGPQALDFVQQLVTNDASKLTDGRAMYTVMCRESGGAVDDLLVYRLSEERYLLVINASNIEKDIAHMRAVLAESGLDCILRDVSDETGLIALQGPRAMEIAERASGLSLTDLPFYHFLVPEPGAFLDCRRAIVSHTGYTGEKGLEIYCAPDEAPHVWSALLEAGADMGLKPAGLGARDTLRLEAGFCLYGNDLNEETNPIEAGLGWVVKLDKGAFVGSEAISKVKQNGPERKLIGFVMEERGIPRSGLPICTPDGRPVGIVTSGSQSPILGVGVGLGYVENDAALTAPGSKIAIDIRGKLVAAEVKKPPFHKS
ncbi:glycine cleavage system aminomethyltransferase GcvT [soil metagenome]